MAVGAEAGDQAFETTEDVVVPAGQLTAQGTILAGEEAAAIVAAAIGPAANVAADAINTILSQNTAARLRGFGNNRERLVLNPEATAGGVDDIGTEITQQDVDDATASLLGALDSAVADALDETGDVVYADPAEPPEPVIEGLDGSGGDPRRGNGRDQRYARLRSPLRRRVRGRRAGHRSSCSPTPRSCRPGTSCCRRRPRSPSARRARTGTRSSLP